MEMKNWLLGLLLLFPLMAVAEVRDAEKHFFDLKLGNFQEELQTAKQQGKQGIMLFFEMDDCPFCARMKATILNQSEVQDYYHKHFLIFPIDTQGDVRMTDFRGKETVEQAYARENRVRATPVIMFFDLEGNPVARHTGPTKDKDDFLLLGRYVIEGAYKEMPFERYKKSQPGKK
jgi:thioredoxin-related protein